MALVKRARPCYHGRMTDTTKPPNRATAPRQRPFGRDESRRQDDRPGDTRRGGDKPRPRDETGARADKPRGGAALTRGAEPAPPKDDARIAKVMARAGLCSRRDAEGWIAAGRVAVNGAVIDSPALNVNPGDRITVDGEPLPEWHYLVCGDPEAVHRAGVSIRGKAIAEAQAGPLEDHVLADLGYDDDLA